MSGILLILIPIPIILTAEPIDLIPLTDDSNLLTFTFLDHTFLLNRSLPSPTMELHVISPKPASARARLLDEQQQDSASDTCDRTWTKLGLAIVICLIIIPVVSLAIYIQLKKVRDDRLLGEALRSLPGMPREFGYNELSKATDNFSQENQLGLGGYGTVFKGKIPTTGEEVAVKSFLRETKRGDFLAELTIINRLRHRNLVALLGWCYKNKKLLLVYVYMPNGSLDKHLYHSQNEILSWERRYRIVTGIAYALHYLHNEYDQKVVHRDIKSSNIMLDSSFNACLGDFGLARAIDEDMTSYEEQAGGVPGTWGYIAPECLHSGKATGKSDVFSFGAVVLEVVCGRRPGTAIGGFRLLVDWVWTMYEEGKLLETIDLRLQDQRSRGMEEEAKRLLLLGLACSHPNASERPKTQTIMQIISKSIPPPSVPLPKPAFIMPMLRESEGMIRSDSITGQDLYPPTRTFSSSYVPRSTPSPGTTGNTTNGNQNPQQRDASSPFF